MDNLKYNDTDPLKEYMSIIKKEDAPEAFTGNIMGLIGSEHVKPSAKWNFISRHSILLVTILVTSVLVTLSVIFTEKGTDAIPSVFDRIQKLNLSFPSFPAISEINSTLAELILYTSLGCFGFLIIDYMINTIFIRIHRKQS